MGMTVRPVRLPRRRAEQHVHGDGRRLDQREHPCRRAEDQAGLPGDAGDGDVWRGRRGVAAGISLLVAGAAARTCSPYILVHARASCSALLVAPAAVATVVAAAVAVAGRWLPQHGDTPEQRAFEAYTAELLLELYPDPPLLPPPPSGQERLRLRAPVERTLAKPVR